MKTIFSTLFFVLCTMSYAQIKLSGGTNVTETSSNTTSSNKTNGKTELNTTNKTINYSGVPQSSNPAVIVEEEGKKLTGQTITPNVSTSNSSSKKYGTELETNNKKIDYNSVPIKNITETKVIEEPNTAVNTTQNTVENKANTTIETTNKGVMLNKQNSTNTISKNTNAKNVELTKVYFNENTSTVNSEYYGELYKVLAKYKENPNTKFLLTGYSDAANTESKNKNLPTERATEVYRILTNLYKVPTSNIEITTSNMNGVQMNNNENKKVTITTK